MDTLEQMLDVHDTITAPLDDFDLVIEPFYKSTCLPIKKVMAQDGFQGVDTSPSLQGDVPCTGHLFDRGQWAILAS